MENTNLCFGDVGSSEYEKYNLISTLFCIQYSGGAQEYFDLCMNYMIGQEHLEVQLSKNFNS